MHVVDGRNLQEPEDGALDGRNTLVDSRFEMLIHFLRSEKHGRISSFPLERVVLSLYG